MAGVTVVLKIAKRRGLALKLIKLFKSTHLGPSLLVSSIAFLFAYQFFTISKALIVFLTYLTGQFVVGWTNDLFDMSSDQVEMRTNKPVAMGEISQKIVKSSIFLSLLFCVGLSLTGPLGLKGGTLHLFAVGCGVSYNASLKSTVFSPIPYFLAFAALPATVYLGAGVAVPTWLVLAAGLFGVAAHFENVLKDMEVDRTSGTLGLPQRSGLTLTLIVIAITLIAIAIVLGEQIPSLRITIYTVTAISLVIIFLKSREVGFQVTMALALADVLLMISWVRPR